ncbi:hypothetical protein F2Q69_00058092 [Brassica cretica]|uniref:Uncharacterized protein n=1 Tax=Brassica cretica TaxID=69181 RepID=A0A8S9RKV4_BRACR|nr:hypothetical protein F2Q69_00058092 [Brassica cretica]
MDSSCWTDVSLNKNRGWRWREGGILLAGLMSLSSRIKGWIEVDLRMRALRGPGLEANFLIPGGLPGFLLGGKALVLVSTVSLSLGRGPRLSEIGTLSLCSSVSWISWGTLINGSTLGGPNLSAIGTRSRDRFIVVSPPI